MTIFYRTQTVDEVEIFYREAGPRDAPVILLLHGFPTAGHMFRDLIPHLGDRYRVIAPDLPGFGNTITPVRGRFEYTFDTLARSIGRFVDEIGLDRYALYVFDYGAPVGLRLAAAHPERVSAIITQNGNAYEEGLSDAWEPWRTYWREPTQVNRDACRASLSPEAIREGQYRAGTAAGRVSPDGYTLDIAYMARPGADEIQLDLILDYRTNVALYPDFQRYLRTHRPPLLAVWGGNDRHFLPAGAEAYRRDLPDAEIHLLDTGHFALETHVEEIAALIGEFLPRHLDASTGRPSRTEERVADDRPEAGTVAAFQRARTTPLPLPTVIERLRSAIAASGLWVLHEIDPQAILARVGHDIGAVRQILFFHPDRMVRLLGADPAALLEAPLKLAIMALPDGSASVRWTDPALAFGRYGNPALSQLGQELATLCEKIVTEALDFDED